MTQISKWRSLICRRHSSAKIAAAFEVEILGEYLTSILLKSFHSLKAVFFIIVELRATIPRPFLWRMRELWTSFFFFSKCYMYLHFTFVALQISVLESWTKRGCNGTSKREVKYRQVSVFVGKCGKMLTGYSFCLAPTRECQTWLRHGLYVFEGRERSQGERRKGHIELSLARLVLVKD